MTTPPWYRFFAADYAKKTAGLSLLEHGAFRVLLDQYYADEKLPSDLDELRRIARAMTDAEKAAVEKIVKRYFHAEGDRLINDRAEREIAERAAFMKQRSDAGKASVAARIKLHGSAAPSGRKPNERSNDRPNERSNERPNERPNQSQSQKSTPETAAAQFDKRPRRRLKGVDKGKIGNGNGAYAAFLSELGPQQLAAVERVREKAASGDWTPRACRTFLLGEGFGKKECGQTLKILGIPRMN